MAQVSSCADDLRSLLGADSVGEREGKVVASPRTTEEVAEVARYANSNALAIEIVGGGTKRGWGNPVVAEILLETAGLAGVREHSWQDLTATVGAGTTWSAMQRALAVHGQMVALDPLWPETATVGGIVATNESGALRLKYGSLRDLIIGMTIVLADGTIAKSGGKVVKNVAGYDLHKLMTGAFGTLGVVTEVTFRLHPVPATTSTWTIPSSAADPACTVMLKILDSHLTAQAMQLRAGPYGFALDVQLSSLSPVLSVGPLWDFAQTPGLLDHSSISPHPDPFTARERLFSEPGIVIKATMLPTEIAILAAQVVRLGGTSVTQATGIMFARIPEQVAHEVLPQIRSSVDAARDGSLTILRMPRQFAALRGEEKAPALMHEIKRRFDPNRILNPGRFVGGI